MSAINDLLKLELARHELETQLSEVRTRLSRITNELTAKEKRRKEIEAWSKSGVHAAELKALDEDIAQLDMDRKIALCEEEELLDSIGLLKSEEASITAQLQAACGSKGLEEFRGQAAELSERTAEVASVAMVAAPATPLSYSQWDGLQGKRVEEAVEQLRMHRKGLVALLDATQYCRNDKNTWVEYVECVESNFATALKSCIVSNLEKLFGCFSPPSPCLFAVHLKLNSKQRLAFTPSVTDIPSYITSAAEAIISAVCGIDRLHPSLSETTEVKSCYKMPLKEALPFLTEVVDAKEKVFHAVKAQSDSILEYICRLEDDYKSLWMEETNGWEAAMFQLMLNKLSVDWVDRPRLGAIVIDTSSLKEGLQKLVAVGMEKTGGLNESLADMEEMAQQEDTCNGVYSPPRASNPHINPLLSQPPPELEARWQEERLRIVESFRKKEQAIISGRDTIQVAKDLDTEREEALKKLEEKHRQEKQEQEKRREEEKKAAADRELKAKEQEMQRLAEVELQKEREEAQAALAAKEKAAAQQRAAEEASKKAKEEEEQQREMKEEERMKQQEREAMEAEKRRQQELVRDMEEKRKRDEADLVKWRKEMTATPVSATPPPDNAVSARTPSATPPARVPSSCATRTTPIEALDLEQGKSLLQVYKESCQELGIKPNSGVLRILPSEPNTHVTDLNLGLNYIGVKGIKPLFQVLRRNRGLTTLNLSNNNLDNAEIRTLVQVLLAAPGASLTSLDLSSNPISLAGGTDLVELLTTQRKLTSLSINDTLIQPKVVERIKEQVALNCKAAG